MITCGPIWAPPRPASRGRAACAAGWSAAPPTPPASSGSRTGSFTSGAQGQGPSHQGIKDRVLHIRRRGGQGRVALSASSLLPCCCLWPGCNSVLLLKHNNTFISSTIILLLLLYTLVVYVVCEVLDIFSTLFTFHWLNLWNYRLAIPMSQGGLKYPIIQIWQEL